MTKQYVIEQTDHSLLDYLLGQIHHSQAVIANNSDKPEVVKQHAAFIGENVQKAIHLVRTD